MKKIWFALATAAFLPGCAAFSGQALPQTLGERASNYGYVPLDPLPIETVGTAGSCSEKELRKAMPGEGDFLPITEALPDIAVRFAVASYKANVGLEFGPTTNTTKGQSYRAILDYVNSDSVTVQMLVRKFAKKSMNGVPTYYPISEPIEPKVGGVVYGYQAKFISFSSESQAVIDDRNEKLDVFNKAALDGKDPDAAEGWQSVAFPIYVGLGFRLTADFQALENKLVLGGLGAIGANADAEKLSGSMTLQSIGVNGLGTTAALALPNKLDQTTIEQSILAIGTGRALIYTDSKENRRTLSPRVIGLYSPVGSDPRLINAVYSELSTQRVKWPRPCKGSSS